MAKLAHQWHKLVTRRLAVQNAIAWSNAFQRMKPVYGAAIRRTLTMRDTEKTDYYVPSGQWEFFVKGLKRLLKDERKAGKTPEEAKRFLEGTLRHIQRLLSVDLPSLEGDKLARLYLSVADANADFYTRMWFVFLVNEPLAEATLAELQAAGFSPGDAGALMRRLAVPLELNDAMQERSGLLRLAHAQPRLSPDAFQRRLEIHSAQYAHIPMFDADHEPFGVSHFKAEIRKIRNPEAELARINLSLSLRKKEFSKDLRRLKACGSPRLAALAVMLKKLASLRDYRDMLRQKLNLKLRGLYWEIGRRMGLNVGQVVLFSNSEISGFLFGRIGRKWFVLEAGRRKKGFVLRQDRGHIVVESGKGASLLARSEASDISAPLDFIRGVCGTPGRAFGRAVVVHTNLDLRKVKPGDVLVAHMTRPDYIPAMRRCKAIVAEEGGVTCHAAIIARELGMPCIVGARGATEAFKTGSQIEVDAGKGFVRRLRR